MRTPSWLRELLQAGLIFSISIFFSTQSYSAGKAGLFSDWRSSSVNYSESEYTSEIDCKSLSSWNSESAQVLLATEISKEGDLPVYCDVLGHIQSDIKFRLFIPGQWNGRFFMVGNGGLAGDDLLQPEYPQHLKKMKAALRHGFVTVMTDSGHSDKEQPGGSFAHNNFSSEVDFAFRAIHVVSETAKAIIKDVYARDPKYSYFDGCSGGGRQGLMSVQRYPDDFNGVVAGAPSFNHTAFSVARMRFNPVLKNAGISLAQIKTMGKLITSVCDAEDGVKDDLIENPLACHIKYDDLLPLCNKVDKKGKCFTPSQVEAIKFLHADIFINGQRLQPGYPVASNLSLSNGWQAWLPTDDKKKFDFGHFIQKNYFAILHSIRTILLANSPILTLSET